MGQNFLTTNYKFYFLPKCHELQYQESITSQLKYFLSLSIDCFIIFKIITGLKAIQDYMCLYSMGAFACICMNFQAIWIYNLYFTISLWTQ